MDGPSMASPLAPSSSFTRPDAETAATAAAEEDTARARSDTVGEIMASLSSSSAAMREAAIPTGRTLSRNQTSTSTTYPIDRELQQQMLQFLGDGPMRFGPAVISSHMNVREHLMQGGSVQLTTYVSLRTTSEVKKKYRRATDEQVLRIVQFCQFQDALAYDLLKQCRPHYFHLTAMDRQLDIQEHRLVVPIPQLQLLNAPKSRILYFRPSRFSPKHGSKSTVIDSIIYILDNWTRHDAIVWSKNQSFASSPMTYGLLVHLVDFDKDSNYNREYWSKFMALLQGRVFPVQVHRVLWVDPPTSFDKLWKTMMSSMMLSEQFTKQNFRLSRHQLGDYLQPYFEEFLPRDEFPDLTSRVVSAPSGPTTINNPTTNFQHPSSSPPLMAMTLEGMARDYLLFQRYLETLQGKNETHQSLTSKQRRRHRRRRRFSMPLKMVKRKSQKFKPTAQLVAASTNGGTINANSVLDGSSSHVQDDDKDEDEEDETNDHDHNSIYDDDYDYDDNDHSSSHNSGTASQRRRRSIGLGLGLNQKMKNVGRRTKNRLPEGLNNAAVSNGPTTASVGSTTPNFIPPPSGIHEDSASPPMPLNNGKVPRRSSLPKSQHFMERHQTEESSEMMGVGGQPVVHRRQRRSSLSVLGEYQEHVPRNTVAANDNDHDNGTSEYQPSPSQRRRRRMSLKAVLSPIKNGTRRLVGKRRGGAGGSSTRSRGPDDDSSYISETGRSQDLNTQEFNQSMTIQQLENHYTQKSPRRPTARRHSTHYFYSNPSPKAGTSTSSPYSNHSSNYSESNNDFHDSNSSSNNDNYNWDKILSDMKQRSMRGTDFGSSPPKQAAVPPRPSRRHSATTTAWPEPPPFGSGEEETTPETAAAAPAAAAAAPPPPPKEKKPQNLSYFLEQVERQKERTRRLQLERKTGNATVS